MLMLWEEISSYKNMPQNYPKLDPFLKPSKPTFSASTKAPCKYNDLIYQLIVACLRPPWPSMQRGPCSLVLHLCVNIDLYILSRSSSLAARTMHAPCPQRRAGAPPQRVWTVSLSQKDMKLWEKTSSIRCHIW